MLLSRYFKPTNQDHLELFNQISENLSEELLGREPKIAWYPSSGFDTQDLIRLSQENPAPDIYFHTDGFFQPDNIHQDFLNNFHNVHNAFTNMAFNNPIGDNIIYNEINVIDPIIGLRFRKRLNFIPVPVIDNKLTRVFLFNVEINYNQGDAQHIIKKPIILFIMDDINFFDEFILKNNVTINFLVRKRQGEAHHFGPSIISLSILFPFLGQIVVQCLLLDCDGRDRRENFFSDEEKILIQCLCYKYGYFLYPNKIFSKKFYNRSEENPMQDWENQLPNYNLGDINSGIVFKYIYTGDEQNFDKGDLLNYINQIQVGNNGVFDYL